ncbi:MAG: hypothetical protein ABI467_01920 [Kofleriaceae bacterium]
MGDARGQVRLPVIGPIGLARLWLSYQRYVALLLGVPALAIGLAIAFAPWWVVILAVGVGLVPGRFAIEVLGRWPRKLRATRVGLARIDAGAFTPASIRSYCGDPCFRVVATELLVRAGIARADRRALVRRFSDELRDARGIVLLVDHVRGTVLTLGGGARERN